MIAGSDCNIWFGSCHNISTEKLENIVQELSRVCWLNIRKINQEQEEPFRCNFGEDPKLHFNLPWTFGSWKREQRLYEKNNHRLWNLPKKSRHVRSKVKVMLTVCFDIEDIIHNEFFEKDRQWIVVIISKSWDN